MSEIFLRDFEALRKLRGKKRKLAIEEMIQKGEEVLNGLVEIFLDDNKSRRELALKIFHDMEIKSDEGFETIGEVVEELLENSKASMRKYGLDIIEKHGAKLSCIAEAFASSVGKEQQEPHLSRSLSFLKLFEYSKEERLATVDPILDSWSIEARKLAQDIVRDCGEEPRETIWKDAPIDQEVIKQIQRLGGSCTKAYDGSEEKKYKWQDAFESREGSRESGKKPKGKTLKFPTAVWFFEHHVSIPGDFQMFGDEYGCESEIRFGPESDAKHLDVLQGDSRILLYTIAVDFSQRYTYAIDLNTAAKNTNPGVYYIDHTSPDLGQRYFQLSKFLGALKPAPKDQ